MVSHRLRRGLGLVGFLVVFGFAVAVAVDLRAADLPPERGIGQRVADFTLKDLSGQPVSLYGPGFGPPVGRPFTASFGARFEW